MEKSRTVRLCPLEEFGVDLWRKAQQMGYGATAQPAFLADGSHWLWTLPPGRFSQAVQILDFWHLSEHVGACAKEFFGEGSDEGRQWSLKVCGTLRAGLVEETLRIGAPEGPVHGQAEGQARTGDLFDQQPDADGLPPV